MRKNKMKRADMVELKKNAMYLEWIEPTTCQRFGKMFRNKEEMETYKKKFADKMIDVYERPYLGDSPKTTMDFSWIKGLK